MKLLADYVDFNNIQAAAGAAPSGQNGAPASESAAGSLTAQLKRGMKMSEVTSLLGQGRQLSESVSSDGLNTQTFEYLPGERRVEVTYVEGVVVRYSISSR